MTKKKLKQYRRYRYLASTRGILAWKKKTGNNCPFDSLLRQMFFETAAQLTKEGKV